MATKKERQDICLICHIFNVKKIFTLGKQSHLNLVSI